jgi:hypothetical protein
VLARTEIRGWRHSPVWRPSRRFSSRSSRSDSAAHSPRRSRRRAGCRRGRELWGGRRRWRVFWRLLLVPKVSAALWERSPRRDSVSLPSHDDFDRRPHALPPATETEFRLARPFPKRCANFGNEGQNG